MIEGEEALEWLKKNEQMISDYYDANRDKIHAMHKAMCEVAVKQFDASNVDLLLHVAFVLDNLHKTEGPGRIEYTKCVGLLALRGGLPLITAVAEKKPETTH